MKHRFFWLILLLFCNGARGQAVIEGRVDLKRGARTPVVNQRYAAGIDPSVVVPDPPAAVVWLEGEFPAAKNLPRLEMAQKDLSFSTTLLPVQLGTTVEFPNRDDTYHNIFSYSKPKRFDFGRYLPNEKPVPSVVFDKPGVVMLHCDIHEHMRSIIFVVASPYFTKSATDGSYRLEKLPAGRYVLNAWLDSKTTLSKPVELSAGTKLQLDFP